MFRINSESDICNGSFKPGKIQCLLVTAKSASIIITMLNLTDWSRTKTFVCLFACLFVCLFCLQGYFKTLRMEVYRDNIGITLICPGLVYSNMRKNTFRENLQTYRDSTFPPTTIKTERCVNLITIAMVNCLDEVWIAIPYRMFDLYLDQYLPYVRNWWVHWRNRKST